MLKALKKICISIVVLCICISPLANFGTTQATGNEETKKIEISRERVCSYQESQQTGYEYVVHVGNVTYTHYYQFRGFYAQDILKFFASKPTMQSAGCGVTSCASLLTGYGKEVTPRDIEQKVKGAFSISSTLASYGVPGQWYNNKTAKEYTSRIEKALAEGKPVIARMKKSEWTKSTQHFIVIVGQDDNYMWTCDPGHSSEYYHKYPKKVSGAAVSMNGVWIPNRAPDGSNAGQTFAPSGDDDKQFPTPSVRKR